MHIAILTVSDRASEGTYKDISGPAIESWLARVIVTPYTVTRRIVPDGTGSVSGALIDLCDQAGADLVLTTGGTGPSPRDQTPEAMKRVMEKELPGFGELLRRRSLEQVPTAILSRQTAGTRGKSLIINLPGRPRSIAMSLEAVFPAVPYCLDLIGAGRIETDPEVLKSFRPEA
nr:molybdopterin adenylyltransferase [uncultured Gellertiella sp.]